jgi:hypothetical protein
MEEGFIQPMIDMANEFISVGLQQFEWQKEIEGTKVMVSRVTSDSKHKRLYGTTTSSTLRADTKVEEFPYVVIINTQDMVKLYQKSITQLDFLDNKDILKLGDVISYSRNGQLFRYKIIDVQTFSEAGGLLNRYTLAGMAEVNSTKESII